jgi:hypothetical protein
MYNQGVTLLRADIASQLLPFLVLLRVPLFHHDALMGDFSQTLISVSSPNLDIELIF